jgi:hypothetical protein
MFLLSGSMHLSLRVLLTVGADEEVSLTETVRIRLLADYIGRYIPNAPPHGIIIVYFTMKNSKNLERQSSCILYSSCQ